MSANSCNLLEEAVGEKVSLGKLAQLTGFPEDFIKKELLLDDDSFSLSELRECAARYLDGICAVEHDNS